jgi:large subunit ribosomal protein L30
MYVVVRLRGEAGTSRDVRDTFQMLGMKKIYSAALLEENPVNLGMIKKVDNFAAWGNADEHTAKIIHKTKNLKPPKGGLKSKKIRFPKGNLGDNGTKINELIKKMI